MNPLVKKEIRLLLPSFVAAVLLAMIQGITRPYDFYVASLLFFGLTIMALTTIGREASLNTFSMLMSQPTERIRIWKTKLCVLAVAFLIVFLVWLCAFGISIINSSGNDSEWEDSYNLFITICLIATSTFTGGLWTALLLRQIAGAFWLTLLVPAVLSGIASGFSAQTESDNLVIAVLCVVIAVYSVGGFLFARRLFFRAQDVGWSGGNIVLPEWKFFARSENTVSLRNRKPVFALIRKELQLHQVTLMGAAGLLMIHIGIIVLRTHHKFAKDSAGDILTSIFWILWLVLPVIIGAMAVAEERRMGVMEGQLCLPVSRRLQFAIKSLLALFLGTLLGGVLPMLLESLGNSQIFKEADTLRFFQLSMIGLAAYLALVSLFASSLANNFLQAIGFAIATFIGLVMIVPAFAKGWMFFFESLSVGSILSLIIAVPTLAATLLLLTYLNFKNFRDGLRLWRRSLLVVAGAMVFVMASSTAIYNRAWEVFEPAEPPHGAAKLSLANPPAVKVADYDDLLVRLPDGRVWFDGLGDSAYDYYDGSVRRKFIWQMLTHPLRESVGPQQFLAGSNWVAATTKRLDFRWFMETVGIQPDGTLWISDRPPQDKWVPGKLQQYGSETNWRQLAQGSTSVVLLKTDGTLWRWGLLTNKWNADALPGLRTFTPYQIGTNSDWQELFTMGGNFARRTDGSVWYLDVNWNKGIGKENLVRESNYDEMVSQTASSLGEQATAFVRPDETLWVLNRYWDEKNGGSMMGTGILQVGKENDWRAVAVNYGMMVGLKADGSLWQWNFQNESATKSVNTPPTRLGIHSDWVAIKGIRGGVITLAADGSLWLWPDRAFDYYGTLIKLPKQPQFLGNVFAKQD